MNIKLLVALLDPMTLAKARTIETLKEIAAKRSASVEPWWAWTVFVAVAISIRKIERA